MKAAILVIVSLIIILIFGSSASYDSDKIANNENLPPNVLFIIADDLALQLGCYGDKAASTPSLDRLASEGISFKRAYACGTVCTPSRKSFMTGLDVRTIQFGNYNYLMHHPEAMTMPRWFREHGYNTAKVGKVMHTDDFEGPYDWDINLNLTETIKSDIPEVTFNYGSSDVDGSALMRTGIYADDASTLDKERTEAFERFIVKQWDRSKPFFFALGFHSPHQRNDANQRHFERLPVNSMPLTIAPEGSTPMTKPFPATFTWWTHDFPDDQARKAVQGYYAAVSMMDELVGRALAFLEKEKLSNNTIIIFTSDQGYNLGYRYIWAKHVLYPSVLNVPLIVKYPGMPKKNVWANGLVELLDIFPTLTELTGLPHPEDIDGTSFVPLMENPLNEGKVAAYAQGILHAGSGIAVTTKNETYMEWDNGTYREFYNLEKDPQAWYNQVDNPDYGEEVSQLENLLHSYFDKK